MYGEDMVITWCSRGLHPEEETARPAGAQMRPALVLTSSPLFKKYDPELGPHDVRVLGLPCMHTPVHTRPAAPGFQLRAGRDWCSAWRLYGSSLTRRHNLGKTL